MADETIENNDSEIVVEKETSKENETTLTVDDYRKLEAEKNELEQKNKKLYARLKKEEEEKSSASKPLVNDNSQVTQELARLKLQVEHGISDPEAVDFIMKNGGAEALKNPYIKGTIDSMLQQKKAEAGAVEDDSGASLIDKKYTKEQLKNMSSDELEKLLPHV